MKYILEIEKFPNKDYTLRIYEGNNIFNPKLIMKNPKHWNKILTLIGIFLTSKKFINIFQEKAIYTKLKENTSPCAGDVHDII
ncbi:MAG: hypothetical protein WCI04_02480 [archaeon]